MAKAPTCCTQGLLATGKRRRETRSEDLFRSLSRARAVGSSALSISEALPIRSEARPRAAGHAPRAWVKPWPRERSKPSRVQAPGRKPRPRSRIGKSGRRRPAREVDTGFAAKEDGRYRRGHAKRPKAQMSKPPRARSRRGEKSQRDCAIVSRCRRGCLRAG